MGIRYLSPIAFAGISLLSVLVIPALSHASEQDEMRARKIVEAFNSRSSELVAPLALDQVIIRDGQGRVDVNREVKYSYFIQTLAPENPGSPTLLIPMATSRYTPTYYQSDDWWDAHKEEIDQARREGRPAPRQDMDEVADWLKQQKLSTNPFVIEVPMTGAPARFTRLQDFLTEHLIANYATDGVVTLYRGGEKPGEIDSWLSGQRPKGARYWTPTANYAWRYARKNRAFLEELVDGRAPLFVFKIPVAEFKAMTQRRWPRLTLGTELTKNAHGAFERQGVFKDHLYQMEYPGEGRLGVEIEVRSNRSGSEQMTRYFKGAITIENLANDRIQVLRRAEERLKSAYPARTDALEESIQKRVDRTLAEARLLIAIREKMPREVVAQLRGLLSGYDSEIAYIDGVDLSSFARERMEQLPSDPTKQVDVREIDSKFGLVSRGGAMVCMDLFKVR